MKGLYIHIPFCHKICNYCDFPKMVSSEENKKLYIKRLKEELEYRKSDLCNIDTVFIGGGTPNSLSNELLEELLVSIKDFIKNAKEATIELNPDLITLDQILILKKYEINRISLGVETFNNKHLKILGRTHTKEIVYEKIKLLKENGFNNINIDLIFGIPGETIEDVKYNLNCFKELKLTHLSYYSLILEDKTIFKYLTDNNKLELVDDDMVADMYDYINKFMKDNEYIHYEISNYAKAGYEPKHNLIYWSEDEYVGIGLGASGFIRPYRYTNYKTLKEYFREFTEEKNLISIDEEKNEFFMLGLRKVNGVNLLDYQKRYNSDPFKEFNIQKLIDKKLLILENDILKVHPDKLFIANLVFEEFLNED